MASSNPDGWPAILYGTAWKKERTAELTRRAIAAGYRAVDTANQPRHYNEAGVGEGVAAAMRELGLAREELFVQTKFSPLIAQGREVPYDRQAPPAEQVEQSIRSSLEHLGTAYLDACLLHAPQHPRGMTETDWAFWSALERCYRDRLIGRIGISNAGTVHIRELLEGAEVAPAAVQNRCFARSRWDRDVRLLCAAHEIAYQGFSLLTANRPAVEHPEVRRLAGAYGLTPQQLVFAFARRVGMIPLTGTTRAEHMAEDLRAVEVALDAEAVDLIENIAAA